MSQTINAEMFRRVFAFCLPYWRRQAWQIGGMATLMLSATALDAAIPLLFGRLIDAFTDNMPVKAEQAVIAVILAATILTFCRYGNMRILLRSSIGIMRDMVEETFQRVQRFSTDWHASTFAGSTVRAITRGVWGYDSLADTLVLGSFPAIILLLSVIGLMAWHWATMGVVVALGVIAYVTLAVTMTLVYITPAARESNAFDTKISGTLADAITCNPVVKSFAAERREEERLHSVAATWHDLVKTTWSRYTSTGFAQNLVSLALQAGILVVGLWLWQQHRASAGDIAYLVTTFTLLQGYLREFSNHFRGLLRTVSDMEEMAKFGEMPLGILDRKAAKPLRFQQGQIVFDRVEFRYPGKSEPLYHDFSLEIAAGTKIGLVGPSGSGKSSFVKLIQRLYDLEGGEIRIDGQNIADVTQQSLRSAIAVVPQDPVLFHRSLAENIAYGNPGASLAQIRDAARRANADDFITRLPQGYDTLVGERGIKLSGGERQRVALARAVLSDAKILIFDEATSSLDSVSEELMQKAMAEVTEGRTTIIIAHRLSTVQKVDRILLFENGKIMEDGSHWTLLAKPEGLYRRLFDTQVLGLIGDEMAPAWKPVPSVITH